MLPAQHDDIYIYIYISVLMARHDDDDELCRDNNNIIV